MAHIINSINIIFEFKLGVFIIKYNSSAMTNNDTPSFFILKLLFKSCFLFNVSFQLLSKYQLLDTVTLALELASMTQSMVRTTANATISSSGLAIFNS